MKAFNKEIDVARLEELSEENLLKGDLAKYNETLCPVCGNILRNGREFQEGINKRCVGVVAI